VLAGVRGRVIAEVTGGIRAFTSAVWLEPGRPLTAEFLIKADRSNADSAQRPSMRVRTILHSDNR